MKARAVPENEGGRVEAQAVARAGVDEGVAAVMAGVRELAHGIDRYRSALGARHGLGISEVVALAFLASAGSVRASDVARRTGLTQGSVTGLLDRLEGHGYTRRVRPPTNRRVVMVELTDAGRELAVGMYAPVLPLLAAANREPGAPDPEQVAHCLSRIASVLSGLAEEAGPGE